MYAEQPYTSVFFRNALIDNKESIGENSTEIKNSQFWDKKRKGEWKGKRKSEWKS